ncbi:intradiol ring-cleavage dioxygenase [Herpetosiphon llansteffanensis]
MSQTQPDDVFDLGLQADLAMWMRTPTDRRRLLKLGAVGIGMVLAGYHGQQAAQPAQPAQAETELLNACVQIPSETAGPYPADGSTASSQNLNVLTRSGIVRNDIRPSLNTSNVATGIPCTVELSLININANCAPLAGYAVYIWHCTNDGKYSLYSSGIINEDYLRGVQASDSNGKVSFTTIFPGCYAGRWPHIHFEIYPSLALATGSGNIVHTSQLALPESSCEQVYATAGYGSSMQNLAALSIENDNVFGNDDGVLQIATVTGDPSTGYTAKLSVGVAGPTVELTETVFLPWTTSAEN